MDGWWSRWVGRRRGKNIEFLRRRYERFQHLIDGNNRVLDLIADAGEKSGGDYLFDQQYVEWLVAELEQAVSGVVYDLNAMTDGRHIKLVAAFENIRNKVHATLSPTAAAESELVIPVAEIDMDVADTVGDKMASLGEIRRRLDLPVPDGFIVSASACRRHFRNKGLAPLIAAHAGELTNGAGVEETATRLREIVLHRPIDGAVALMLKREIKKPDRVGWMYAVRSSALGEDGEHSFAGQHQTLLNIREPDVLNAYREVLASLFSTEALRYRLHKGIPVADALMAVGFLAMVPARASGVAHTLDPAAPQKDIVIVSAAYGLGPTVVQGLGPADRFELSRDPIPRVLSRRIARKEAHRVPRYEGGTEMAPVPASDQAVACISDEELSTLAGMALRIERHAGHYREIEWAIDRGGRIVILQSRALRVSEHLAREDAEGKELSRLLADRPVVFRDKGVIACGGVGAGPVVVVRTAEDVRNFPQAGVLVAHSASPQYSSVLARANAAVTSVGSSTGHLAVVAREFRVPMLVDVREATEVLRSGMEVTVDAEQNVVYEGVVRELLRYQLSTQPREVEFEEFRVLRRLLRRITPLNLSDPDAEIFLARSCSTYHDVIRFAHEMAVRELVDMPGLASGDRKRFVGRLKLDITLDLDILDIRGGIALGGEEPLVEPDKVRSVPLTALLKGLLSPGAWRTEPVDMDAESFLASATRTASFAVTNTSPVRPNLAVITKDYMNLHLLLGYHFNMVDCHLSDNPTANYIYFRFTGGVTDITRRSRRARAIAAILQEHDFGVEVKGDLVIGRLRNVGRELMQERLEMLGRLIGFTRQLDVLMRDEGAVQERTREFIGRDPISFNIISEDVEAFEGGDDG